MATIKQLAFGPTKEQNQKFVHCLFWQDRNKPVGIGDGENWVLDTPDKITDFISQSPTDYEIYTFEEFQTLYPGSEAYEYEG